MGFDVFPGWPTAISCKLIKLGPLIDEDLVDGEARGSEQTQRLGLHGIRQADGERERLRLRHLRTPVLFLPKRSPAFHIQPVRLFCATASRTADQQARHDS